MFDDPSSGSKTMMYLPVSTERLNVTGSSSSSLTSAATESRSPRQCSRAWFAYTSSFCCCSPCTLVCPIAPRTSFSPAVRIFASTILVASVIPLSSQLNRPLASLISCCCCRICCCTVVINCPSLRVSSSPPSGQVVRVERRNLAPQRGEVSHLAHQPLHHRIQLLFRSRHPPWPPSRPAPPARQALQQHRAVRHGNMCPAPGPRASSP